MSVEYIRDAAIRALGPEVAPVLNHPGCADAFQAFEGATATVGGALLVFTNSGSSEDALRLSRAALDYCKAKQDLDRAIRAALVETAGGTRQ